MYIGIDQSLACTGLIALDSKKKLRYAYPNKWSSKYPEGDARLSYYRQVLKRKIDRWSIKFAAWEDYAWGKTKMSMGVQVGELGGVIRQLLDELSIPVLKVGPQQVKLWAGRKTPTEIVGGQGRCRCGGTIIKGSKGKVKKMPSTKVLKVEWKCARCDSPYTDKDDIILYITSIYGDPWAPLKFDGISDRAVVERFNANEKVLSDLCDAAVLAEICYYYNGRARSKKLTGNQLSVLNLLESKGK